MFEPRRDPQTFEWAQFELDEFLGVIDFAVLVELDIARGRCAGNRVLDHLFKEIRSQGNQVDVALLAVGAAVLEPGADGQRRGAEVDSRLGDVAPNAVFVGLGITRNTERRSAARGQRYDIGRRNRCWSRGSEQRDIVAAQRLIVVAVGVGTVLECGAWRDVCFKLHDLEIGGLARVVVTVVRL